MTRAGLLVLAACGSAPAEIRIDAASPNSGPLGGGTRIVITGDRFADDDAGPTRVLVGGRQAELAAAIDDESLELVLPPGDRPGDAELVVFNRHGVAVSTTAFHYADVPAILEVTPGEILATAMPTMTVTGSGFLDDGAGTAQVYVDDVLAENVIVTSDTTLTFTAPIGRALQRPRVELANTRGLAGKDRAFRYRPSMRPGLLLFARGTTTFATFFDPVDNTVTPIPRIGPFYALSAVVRDDSGEYRAIERSQQLGRLDLSTQRFEQAIGIATRVPAMVRRGGVQYAIDRNTLQIGSLGDDGVFSPLGTATAPCCGSYGIADDGTTLYFTSRTGADKYLTAIDRVTGALGPPVKLLAGTGFHVEEMRFFGGKLYATSRDSTLVEIDPATGVVTVIAGIARANAMEVFP